MDRPQLAILNHLLNQRPEVRAQLEALSGRRVALHFPMVSVRAVIVPGGVFGRSACWRGASLVSALPGVRGLPTL